MSAVGDIIEELLMQNAARNEFVLLHGREPSETELAEFRPRFEAHCRAERERAFDPDEDDVCPTCGRSE